MNELLDRFEKLVSAGEETAIEEWLSRVDQSRQAECFAQLLAIEIFYRDKRGEAVEPNEYLDRFPDHQREIAQAFIELEEVKLSIEPTIEHRASIPGSSPSPNRQIGPYKLLEQIGEGGMGSVWMAEQKKPVRRRVALKLIKSQFASPELIARFDAERQALAMMNHPNIARILDAGTTGMGQPYFVMEFVGGTELTKYCDSHRLSINDRLRLFADVCSGVQHAHQKGIIHRDLKPGNIIVGLEDGTAVAKIIDFGLAKAMESTMRLTDQSLFTGIGRILGTLKYMSPEQASLDAIDIDTRTDIYALGVILYELLTGSTPLDETSIKDQAAMEVLELIRDRDPVKPSSQLSGGTDEQISMITNKRQTDRSRLNQILAGDLDWIVMKALEKDRTRRYESASGFADDIQRYLNNEPVIARPPSLNYQMKKFVRKNRAGVAAAALVLAVLVIGLAGTTWQMRRAQIAEGKAENAKGVAEVNEELAVQAKNEADAQRRKSDDLRRVADANFEKAWGAITSLSKLGEDPRLRQRGVEPLRREILTKAKMFYSELVANEPDKSLPWEYQLRRLNSMYELSDIEYQLGNHEAAVENLHNARKQMEVVGEPAGDRAKMFSAYVARSLGNIFSTMRRFDESARAYQRASRIVESIQPGDYRPETLQIEQAIIEAGRGHSSLRQRDYKSAEASLDRGIKILERLTANDQFDSDHRVFQELAEAYIDKFNIKRMNKDNVAAQKIIDKATSIYRKLLAQRSSIPHLRYSYAMSIRDLGNWQLALVQGANTGNVTKEVFQKASVQLAKAENNLKESIEAMESLVGDFPSVTEYRFSLAELYTMIADVYMTRKKTELVTVQLKNAQLLFDRLPDDPQYPAIAEARNNFLISIGDANLSQQNYREAKTGYKNAIPRLQEILNNDPTNIISSVAMLKSISGLGRSLVGLGEIEAAAAQGEKLINLGQGHFGDAVMFDGAVIIGLAAVTDSENESERAKKLKSDYLKRSRGVIRKLRQKKQLPFLKDLDEYQINELDQFRLFLERFRQKFDY